jgi:hypothetical protein
MSLPFCRCKNYFWGVVCFGFLGKLLAQEMSAFYDRFAHHSDRKNSWRPLLFCFFLAILDFELSTPGLLGAGQP